MKAIILFLLISSSLSLFSQNITIEETIKYIDNSLKEYYFSIGEKNDGGNRVYYFQMNGIEVRVGGSEEFEFNINDISITKTTSTTLGILRIDPSYDIVVKCTNTNCIKKGNSFSGATLISEFYIRSTNEILTNRLYNALQNLKYLISLDNNEKSSDKFDDYLREE
ncbi:MAG TPA: hypothetical protein P5145_02190, partial [Tenuifilaceae bacterium]|nr:hypothetical protein [Tenuifilaceae bacterium]